jgi:hypothetical protein
VGPPARRPGLPRPWDSPAVAAVERDDGGGGRGGVDGTRWQQGCHRLIEQWINVGGGDDVRVKILDCQGGATLVR